jgi:hypothetical protein
MMPSRLAAMIQPPAAAQPRDPTRSVEMNDELFAKG